MIRSFKSVGLLMLSVLMFTLSVPARAAVTDTVAPADITSLTSLAGATGGTVVLQWTATGDDGATGTALRYIVKYATFNLAGLTTGQWWIGPVGGPATTYPQSWVPRASGQAESQSMSGLIEGVTYYFGIIAQDSCNNSSSLVFSSGGTNVIPTLTYSSYLGGTVDDRVNAITLDSAGNVYLAGQTVSGGFPGSAGQYQSANAGGTDAFVTKISPAGAILWSTYLGGAGIDIANAIAVDSLSIVHVTGNTTSANFPTASPYQAANGGGTDAFVTAISSMGTALVYSTYLGGAGVDDGYGIAVDTAGNAYVTGDSTSNGTTFPQTAGAYQTTAGGASDAFVTKFLPTGATGYSTFLGGTGADIGRAIAIDSVGNAYVTGQAADAFFPTASYPTVFKPTITGAYDAFIAKLSSTGATLPYVTYVGGSGIDDGFGIALDGADPTTLKVYITGYTFSADFPKPGFATVGQTTIGTAPDAYVFKLNVNGGGGNLDGVYATYLGASGDDRATAITVDTSSNVYVTGHTLSGDFPTVNPIQGTLTGTGMVFVTEIGPTGAARVFSSYLGGVTDQQGNGIALDSSKNMYVTGWTNSTDYPTASPFQAANAGSYDGFVTKISAPLPPSTATNKATALAVYPAPATVSAVSGDKGGRITFSFTHTGDDATSGLVTNYLLYRSTYSGAVSSTTASVITVGSAVTTIQTSTITAALLPKTPGTADAYIAMGLTPGALYYFRLEARDEKPNGALSAEVSALARQDDTRPLPVTSLSAQAVRANGDGTIDVTWSYSPDQDQSLPAAYIIYYSSFVQMRSLTNDHKLNGVLASTVVPTFSLTSQTLANSTQTVTLAGLNRRQNFWVTVVASDTAGLWQNGVAANVSDVITVVAAQAADATGPESPAVLSPLVIGTGGGQVSLSWVAPVSDTNTVTSPAVARYEIKYATYGAVSTGTWWTNGEGAALWGYDRRTAGLVPGQTETQVISGLAGPATAYWFAVRAYDVAGSSGVISAASSSTVVGSDTLSPNAIIDLAGARDANVKSTLNLSWTAPSDSNSGVNAYAVKWATGGVVTSTAAWWNGTESTVTIFVAAITSVSAPGVVENRQLTGMTTLQNIYIMARSSDAAGNVSLLSNLLSFTSAADATAPGQVTDLAVSSVSIVAVTTLYAVTLSAPVTGQVELTWTAPGDDVNVGNVASMLVRYSTLSAISAESDWTAATPSTNPTVGGARPAPSVLAPATKQSYVVTGLTVGTTYYFAVRGLDAAGNLGALSGGTVTSCLPSQMVSVLSLMDLTANGTPIHSGEYYHIGPINILGSTSTATGMASDDAGRGVQLNKNGAAWLAGGTAPAMSKRLMAVSGRVSHANGQLSLEDIRESTGSITTASLPAPVWSPTIGMLQNGSANLADAANAENYESRLVALRGVQKVDATSNVWPTGTGAINYLVYDDTSGATVQTTVRFSQGIQMSGNAEPGVGVRFDVIGVLGQFDGSDPRYQGYQVFPTSNTANTKALGIIERPRGLSALAGPVGSGSVTLTWTAVQDPDRNGFLISSGPSQNGPWTMFIDTPSAGLSQITVTSGLTANTSYYFAVQMKQAPNTTWSALGSAGNAYLQSGAPMANGLSVGEIAWVGSSWGADVTAPSSPTAVAAVPSVSTNTEGAIALTWTAPGNDGVVGTAAKYLIRYATWPTTGLTNTTDWWNGVLAAPVGARAVETYLNVAAPQVSGTSEAITLSGLVVGATYYIAMRAVDYAGNVSTLSNWVFAPASNLKPQAPTGLVAAASDKGVVLTWQASAVPGQFGETLGLADVSSGSYRIYWNDGRSGHRDAGGSSNGAGCYDNVIPASQTAVGISVDGLKRTYAVGGLVNGHNYYFAVSAVDSIGNEGTVSSPELVASPVPPPQVKITEAQFDGPSGTKDQFIEIYNASNAPIDISRYIMLTRSLSSAFNANFEKAFVPTGTTLGARQHYVVAFVENTGLYRVGTRLGISYPQADFDWGDPETLDAVNEKASSQWAVGQGPGRSAFGMSMGTNIILLTAGAEANLDKSVSGSWKIGPNSLPGNPIADMITIRAKTSGGTSYNANSDGVWPDGNGKYLDLPNDSPAGVGPSIELRPNYQTLSIQRINEDADTDSLSDWTVARANPGISADAVAPARPVGLVVDGRNVTNPILDNVEGGIKLTFPAVGDDGTLPGNLGRANGYIVNFATWAPLNSADLSAWMVGMSTYVSPTPQGLFLGGANVQTVSWVPSAPGVIESHRLSSSAFAVGKRYWFVVRAVDDAGNDSGFTLDAFSPFFNPNPVGWVVVNPFAKTPRVAAGDFGKSSLYTRPDKSTKTLVKTPGYLADTGNPDAGTPDRVTLPANSLDPETVPTCVVTLTKGGLPLKAKDVFGGVYVGGVLRTDDSNALIVTVNPDGSLPDIIIGDRSKTKVGEEAAVPDQVDITFPALPGFTLTRYNDVYAPSKPGEGENTVKPVVDSGAGTITGSKGTVEPFSTVVFYGQNPAGKTRTELAALEIKLAPTRAGGAPYAAFASTTSDTNGGFPTTSVGTKASTVYVVLKDASGNLSPAFGAPFLPTETKLDAIGPNPLIPSKQADTFSTFWFNVKDADTKVKLLIFNQNGELVKTLLDDDSFNAGYGRAFNESGALITENTKRPKPTDSLDASVPAVSWNGMNESGSRVASGVYLVRFEAGGVKTTKKMLVIQ